MDDVLIYISFKLNAVQFNAVRIRISNNFMDQHRYDASLDQDPTFHLGVDPDPDSDPTPNFSHVGKAVPFYIVLSSYSTA